MTKYTKEIKLSIYHEWVDDDRRGAYLSRKYGMRPGEIAYMVALLQRHGEGILDRPQQKYTADFKLAAIDRVLLGGEALRQVSLDLGLTNTGILANWLRSFKENGYTVITKKKGRPPKNAQKQGQTADQRIGRAGKEAYSRACIHKKIGGLNSRTQEPRKEELARAINELRQELRLSVKYIIDVINTNPGLPHISRSNYYYQTHKLDKDSGNQKLMDRIKEIFLEHRQRYGYRRIYGQLRREDYEVNHKKVQR
ncbi:IS3 family transposase, partial [Lactobacillus delbrueckii]